ncbi:MAG: hydrogenase maturation nickel metallochaperone HypA [Lachnospiraceae bacterium]|nr:hydrogenase maturation nickel metallochaperone HypA [Lachnospiraceae bacterium]
MHELPFVIKLLGEAEETARRENLARISRLRLRIGELSGIEPECVKLYFETASEGTAAEGALLDFCVEPAKLRCEACGTEYDFLPGHTVGSGRDPFSCPACGGSGTLIKGTGTEASLESLEGE